MQDLVCNNYYKVLEHLKVLLKVILFIFCDQQCARFFFSAVKSL